MSDDNVRVLTDSTEDPSAVDTSAAKQDISNLESQISESQGNAKKLKELNHQLKIAQVRASVK